MQSRGHAAWKKSRKFGDVHGGRTWPKLTDKIFNRKHSLSPPAAGQELPIFLSDSVSSDFFFPISSEDIRQVLAKLPVEQTSALTHIWLRKVKTVEYLKGNTLQGYFICGSGVNLIVLHAFPRELKMRLGKRKLGAKTTKYYRAFSPSLHQDDNGWYLLWVKEEVKRYYLQSLLLHEIGHSLHSYYKQYWSTASHERCENFAAGYARFWANNVIVAEMS